jgi:hypothetical protein
MGTGTGSVQLSDMLHTYVHSRTLFSNWLLPPGYSEKWRTQNEIEPINTICMKKILGFLTAQKAKLQQQINNGSITSPWWCSVVLYAKGPSNKESGIDS